MNLTDEQQASLNAWLDVVEEYEAIRTDGGNDELSDDECSETIDVAFEAIVTMLLEARKTN